MSLKGLFHRKSDQQPKNMEKVERISHISPSPMDPNGSYTGRPMDPKERPVQDADDL